MDPTRRFANRVENYLKYRPDYPAALVALLRDEIGLAPGSEAADIGSGTGKLTELLLGAGYRVLAVEPNAEMRSAAEALLGERPGFVSVDGRAEATSLPDASVDFVVAAQAYHWFERKTTAAEFRRILRPGGVVALVWNDRQLDTTSFLRGYEDLLKRHSPDYVQVSQRYVREADSDQFVELFGTNSPTARVFPHRQVFDWDGLLGRMLSSSYVPADGPVHDAMVRELRELFDAEATAGSVAFLYDTRVFYGRP